MKFFANYIANLVSVAQGKQPVLPLMFSFYLTHRCSLNCRYCCDGDGKRFKEDPIPELSTRDAKKLLFILRKASDTLDITGGEPMLRGDLEEILCYAKKIGFRTVLNTKGIGLEDRPEILNFTDVLVISIDTLDSSLLAALIGRPCQVADSILSALDFSIARAKSTNTKIVLSCVATPCNLSEVGQVLSFTEKNRLGFHLSPEILGTTVNPMLQTNQQYQALVDKVIDSKRRGAGVLGIEEYLLGIKKFSPFRCHPLLMPVIRPDGRIYYPCLESKQAKVDILSKRNYRSALQAAKKDFGEIPACNDCCHIFCHMGLSLYQRHPFSAIKELKNWRN